MNDSGNTILVAEDEPLVGLDIADSLRAAGAKIIFAQNFVDALDLTGSAQLSAAVLDINLVGENCSLNCEKLITRHPIHFTRATQWQCSTNGSASSFEKPCTPGEIVKAVCSLFGMSQLILASFSFASTARLPEEVEQRLFVGFGRCLSQQHNVEIIDFDLSQFGCYHD